MMFAYYSESKGSFVDMSTMHPSHLINALNLAAKQAAHEGEKVSNAKLIELGQMVLTLVSKGMVIEAVVGREQHSNEAVLDAYEEAVLDAYEESKKATIAKNGACPKCEGALMPDGWCGHCKESVVTERQAV